MKWSGDDQALEGDDETAFADALRVREIPGAARDRALLEARVSRARSAGSLGAAESGGVKQRRDGAGPGLDEKDRAAALGGPGPGLHPYRTLAITPLCALM